MDEDGIEDYVGNSSVSLPPPDLWADNAEYLIAFLRLSPSRQVGFSVGAIPVSEIRAYCDLFGVDDVETFFQLIRALDSAWLDHSAKKSKEK